MTGTHPRRFGPPQRHPAHRPVVAGAAVTFAVLSCSSSTRPGGPSRTDFFASRYLSPFYSPCVRKCPSASDFGTWIFGKLAALAGALILIFPLGFRLTCYYYRKAYYRAFWLSPPACAVSEPHKTTPARRTSR